MNSMNEMKKDWKYRSTSFAVAGLLNSKTDDEYVSASSAARNTLPSFRTLNDHYQENQMMLSNLHRSQSLERSACTQSSEGTPSEYSLAYDKPRRPLPPSRESIWIDKDEEDVSNITRGGRWTTKEHERFLVGFRLHGHKWKRVQEIVRTRSVTQVRTHAQKYLIKLAKSKKEKERHRAQANEPHKWRGFLSPDSIANDAFDSSDSNDATDMPQMRKRTYNLLRKSEHRAPTNTDIDQDFITAAATILCLIMRQNACSEVHSPENRNCSREKSTHRYYTRASDATNSSQWKLNFRGDEKTLDRYDQDDSTGQWKPASRNEEQILDDHYRGQQVCQG